MKIIAGLTLALVLAGCSQAQTTTQPPATPAQSTPAPSTPAPSTPAPTQSAAASGSSTPTPEAPSTEAFCDYLEDTAEAQQSIEDPTAYVQLIAGAQAVAPGSISDDLALYVTSTEKLALTITGTPEQAAKADAWLTRNEAAVEQAQANLDAYTESTCGRPFTIGE